MQEYTVSISIVTYNNEEHIGPLLDSLKKYTKKADHIIYVVDNGSIDKTVEIVRNYDVVFIQNKKNIGFGAGHNLVIQQIKSKYHVCINPDIVIDNDVISDIADYMDFHEDIGILIPKILNIDSTIQILPKRDPKLIYLVSRRIHIKLLQKYRHEYEMQGMDYELPFDIEFTAGCFMFIRTDIIQQIGGFDERYFLYFEDADMGRSIRKYARAQYNPSFKVYHHWNRACKRELKYFIIQIHSMFKYMIKWRRKN
jgi:hypothetical protein